MGGSTFTHAANRSATSMRAKAAASVDALNVVSTITAELVLVLFSKVWYLYSRSKRVILPRTGSEKARARHDDDLFAAQTTAAASRALSRGGDRVRADHRRAGRRSRAARDAEGAAAIPDARGVACPFARRECAPARGGAAAARG